jgi:hypothetical protein
MIHVGDYGQELIIELANNVSQADELKILFTLPDGSTVEKTSSDGVELGAVDVSDDCGKVILAGTYLAYRIEQGLLTQSGKWKIQAIIITASSQETGSRDLLFVSH